MQALGDITLCIETSNPSAPGSPGVCVGQLAALDAPDLRAGAIGSHFQGVHLLSIASISDNTSTPKQRNEDRLMVAIEQAMNAAGLTPRQIKRIAVSIGPGGFTSVRLAVTSAKCIAEVTGAACIPVPTALVAAVRFAADLGPATPTRSTLPRAAFAVALASKGADAYVQAFSTHQAPPGVTPLTQGKVIDAQGLADLVETHAITTLLADDFLPEAMRHRAVELGVSVAPISLDPIACLAASRTIDPVDPVDLLPLYPREPEAVTKWRQLHGETPH